MSRAGTFVYRFSLLNINKYSGTGYSKYSTDMANSNTQHQQEQLLCE